MSEIEWLCKACNTIHPAPDGLNLVCPTCGKGTLQPSTLNERRLEAELSAAMFALSELGLLRRERTEAARKMGDD